jgi:transcriptional regulator with XRE-family HTH domain
MEDRYEQQARRLAELLDDLVRLAGLSYRTIEEQAGISYNTLWRVLRGVTRIQLSHVLLLLDALEIHPADFMEIAFPVRKLHKPDPKALQRLRALAVPPGTRPAKTLEEITSRLEAALGKRAGLDEGDDLDEDEDGSIVGTGESETSRRPRSGPSGLRRPGRPRKKAPRV